MKKIIAKTYDDVSKVGADMLADVIRNKPRAIIGLATGSTPIGMYKKLVEYHQNKTLDFSQVTAFNLDEYYPILNSNPQSYHYFMWEHLFAHINMKAEMINLPNGQCEDPQAECAAYEKKIAQMGGIDVQVLGIGNNGHIGFNEPASHLALATHLTSLSKSTIEANARFFSSAAEVPTQALTMGMGTIMQAKSIILLITGSNKAAVAKEIFRGQVTTEIPASLLHLHQNVTVLLDEAAAALL